MDELLYKIILISEGLIVLIAYFYTKRKRIL
ncbi:hypothetical protein LCGC14_1103370 [marine sediment metagenome]|uniref:Uncharacterized protein n=1 Tax=marine sediment metagenome TaxID=412755 RepID=A0A0F9M8U7_9ZZZZ